MEAVRVGIREFRKKLASYSWKATCLWRSRGTTIRLATTFLPDARGAETERAALREAAARLQQVLAAEGISEDEIRTSKSGGQRRRDDCAQGPGAGP